MSESAAQRDSPQAGKLTLTPPPLPVRAEELAHAIQGDAEFTDPESLTFRTVAGSLDRAETEEAPVGLFAHLAAALISLGSMSFMSSALFHLIAWGTALVLLPLFGFDWLEFRQEPPPPISASLGDEEVLDDLAQLDMTGSLSAEMDKPQSSLQQLAQQLQKSDAAWLDSASSELFAPASEASVGASDGGGVLLKMPEGGFAVTKGSFTAFTIPATPQPLKPYRIVIEVRLPGDVKKYRVSDLKGEVIGTDGYKQLLPYDRNAPSASRAPAANGKEVVIESSTSIDVINNRVQIIIVVPGARNLVKDRIKIRSRRLREDQELTLTFGKPQTPDAKEPEE